MATLLFTEGALDESLKATQTAMERHLIDWDPNALLNAPVADVVVDLIDRGSVRCPDLLVDEASMEEPTETLQQYQQFGEQYARRVPQLSLTVPFIGERDVFRLRANNSSFNQPSVDQLRDSALVIAWENPISDSAAVRAFFDGEIAKIQQHLDWSRAQIDTYNKQITASVPALVEGRRTELLTIRNLQAEIGFPIRRRADAATYSVPIDRRTLSPIRPAARRGVPAFKPEPAMSTADYEDVLEVLHSARNGLERSPSTAAKLKEEEIRDLLLVSLNAQFKGQAGGELFNGNGKTDILVRVQDRNIFIGECKIWKGPKPIQEALDQLLGYVVWRDTKAALLLFIRNTDVTSVIAKATAEITSHPQHKRPGAHADADRHDFVMHAAGDRDREIYLTFLPFALPRPQRSW
jgi:hypothetical protein